MSALSAEKLVKIYKGRDKTNSVKALDGIDLEVEKGEFTAIMGPSGSGKTTLLNILGGLDRSYNGKVSIAGTSMNHMSRDELALFRRRRLGIVFQDFNLLCKRSIPAVSTGDRFAADKLPNLVLPFIQKSTC